MKTKEIGYRIRKLRESKDFSQENMAAELNITGSAYAKIERGNTDPSASRLIEIAKILGVDVAEFFQEKPIKIQEPQNQWGFATKGDIEELVKMIKALAQEVEKIKTGTATSKPSTKKPARAKK